MKAPCLHEQIIHEAKATEIIFSAELNASASWLAKRLCNGIDMLKLVASQIHSKQPPVC